MPPAGSVPDLGCCAGRGTLELANRGYKAAGVDVSEALLRVAAALVEERNLHIPFARIEPLRLPFAGGSFDAVVAFKVYAYIPHRSARLDYLKEIHRVLRAGGQLLMTHYVIPPEAVGQEKDDYYERVAPDFTTLEAGDYFPCGTGYVHWFTEEELRSELEASPFQLELFCGDQAYGGQGAQTLVALRKVEPVQFC